MPDHDPFCWINDHPWLVTFEYGCICIRLNKARKDERWLASREITVRADDLYKEIELTDYGRNWDMRSADLSVVSGMRQAAEVIENG